MHGSACRNMLGKLGYSILSFFPGRPVRHDAREPYGFCDPAPVGLPFKLDT
jgi:hypothetical protein